MKIFFASLLFLLLPFARAAQGQSIKSLEDERLSQSGVAITIIFDDSGSMDTENRMVQAKAAFSQWLGGIPLKTKLGLIALNRGVLVPLGQNNRDEISREVSKIEASGGTPLTRTIYKVGDMIQERRKTVTPYERHIVIVFTDGDDSEFVNDKVVEALQNLGKATIETVGIGFHGHGEYMEKGATQYYNASDSAELVQALKKVASEVDQQSDIVVSPQIAAEMAQVSGTDQVLSAIPSPKPESERWPFKFIFFIIALGVIIFKVFGPKKSSGSSGNRLWPS